MPRSRPRALPRPRPALSASVVDKPPCCISCARAHICVLELHVAALHLALSSVSSHPPTHTNPSRTARIIASHSGSPPANRWLTHCSSFPTGPGQLLKPCTLHLSAPSARGPLSPGPCCSPPTLFARPSHQLLPCSHHPSSIHQSTIPSACLARPCFFVSTGPLQQVDFDLALDWTDLDWIGLLRYLDICWLSCSRARLSSRHTHTSHTPSPFSCLPAFPLLLDRFLDCSLLASNKPLCDTSANAALKTQP